MATVYSVPDHLQHLIPQLGNDEKEDIHSTLAALSAPGDDSIASMDASTQASKLAMGDDDVKNIFYINFDPEKNSLSDTQRRQLQAVQANIDLNTNFLSLKSGGETQKKLDSGELKSDMSIDSQFARGSYRAKVTDYFIRNSSWIGIYSSEIKDMSYSLNKSEFHAQLLNDVLKGLSVPSTIFSKLEGVLQAISESISSTNTTTKNRKMFWIMITLYKWEPVMQQMRPTIRTIYFEATNDISTYTSKKKDVTKVDIKLGFAQGDYIFNSSVFEAGAKGNIQNMLAKSGGDLVNKPVNIPL